MTSREPHTIDGTAVEEGRVAPAAADAVAQAGTDLALRPSREALTPIDPDQVVAGMAAYQALLPRLLEPSDFQDAGQGRKFVKRSGWRKIARAFNLSLVLVRASVERDADGNAIRAEAVYRAIAPNGQCQDDDGYCSIDEPRFADAKGRQKIENDLRATATTRSKSRAIADLVGMGDVSAEEVSAGSVATLEASDELQRLARNAIGYLLDGDADAADALGVRLSDQFDGAFPAAAGQAIVLVARAVKTHREATAS